MGNNNLFIFGYRFLAVIFYLQKYKKNICFYVTGLKTNVFFMYFCRYLTIV